MTTEDIVQQAIAVAHELRNDLMENGAKRHGVVNYEPWETADDLPDVVLIIAQGIEATLIAAGVEIVGEPVEDYDIEGHINDE